MEKADFKKLDAYQARRGAFRVMDVPPLQYLAVDGHGDPNTSRAFREAVEALFPLAYGMKFASKKDHGRDYVVMPLEGLWWAEDMDAFTAARDKSQWDWTLLIMTPDWLGEGDLEAAREKAASKEHSPRLGDVRLETRDEGTCVQTLHVGAFDEEAQTLARMHHEFIPGEGYTLTGIHHEIYLSDFRKVAPEKQRTILRQPVARG